MHSRASVYRTAGAAVLLLAFASSAGVATHAQAPPPRRADLVIRGGKVIAHCTYPAEVAVTWPTKGLLSEP